MGTFVMVHGSGHGGWSWQKVAPMLEAEGHRVYAPSLTGCGDRAHLVRPDTGIETHVTEIADLLFYEDLHDVILVAHSSGGIATTGVADRRADRVAAVVYVDSPRGSSNAEAFPPVREMRKSGRVVDGVELVLFPDEALVSFYGVNEPEEAAWMLERLTPHPWKAIEDRLEVRDPEALDRIPRYHIVADSSVAFGVHDKLPAEDRAPGHYWEIEGSHDLMLTNAEGVAHILLEIASKP